MMKHANFDGRLDGIMVRAAVRLHERMAFAFARGVLGDYLRRIGLVSELGLGRQHNANLSEIEDRALMLLAKKLRRARKTGTLKSQLQKFNMSELLQAGAGRSPRREWADMRKTAKSAETTETRETAEAETRGKVIRGPFMVSK